MINVFDVEAKALKKVAENEQELSFLIYLQALGFVTANVRQNKHVLSEMIRENETEKEEYQKGISLQISGYYDFGTRRLDISEFHIQKDA